MEKARITAVSYLNTLPFVYGLKKRLLSGTHELSVDVPSECARKVLAGAVDFGLVPVAVLPEISSGYDILNYGIAANGRVESVLLLSRVPLEKIVRVQLDADSRTSVMLVRLLSEQYWHISPEFSEQKNLACPSPEESVVVIGDKAFEWRKRYPYSWDLAEAWKNLTGYPFVFAIWVARKGTDPVLVEMLKQALEYGIGHIEEAAADYLTQNKPGVNLLHYLKNCIEFAINAHHREGLAKFLSWCESKKSG